jgi:hypothetical protein
MFRTIALTALALALAIIGGTASVWHAVDSDEGIGAQRMGPWAAQLAEDNPYAVARRARNAQLPFGIAEGLVFRAHADDEGRALSGRCAYLLEGDTPVARLWTLHVATDGRVTPPSRGEGLHSRQILRRADGSFVIAVAPQVMPGNWIPAPPDQPFTLVLTLFDTPVASTLRISEQAYPAIRRIDCA